MPNPLRILVAGAGIGGLAAALACSRAGHRVEVFEKSAELTEVGAGIQLGPNVTRILHGWGLAKALQSMGVYPECLQVRDTQSGRQLGQLRLGQSFAARYGAPYATVHRADLQRMLAATLLDHHDVTPTLGRAVAGFSQAHDAAQMQLKTGDGCESAHQGDLIIGADGLWSIVRQGLLEDGQPRDTGHVAYRCLIRQADLPQSSRVALGTQDVVAWLGQRQHWVHYPVRGGDWLNVVVILEKPSINTSADWNQAADRVALDGIKPGLNTVLRDLLAACDASQAASGSGSDQTRPHGWRQWNLFSRQPMQGSQQHGSGRVALLGDAAHPMLPYLAQGAGMAIEDAKALVGALASGSDVPGAVANYARARWQRNARVQRRAERNGQIFHASGVIRLGRDVAMQVMGERLLDMPWLYAGG